MQRPDRKRLRLRTEQCSPPDEVADRNAAVLPDKVVEQPHVKAGAAPHCRRKACSGARPSELNRAFGNWWDRRGGVGLEYLSGRAIETFPLLRPLPEVPLAEPPGEVLDNLMKVFEPECVKRMPNGITCNVAACIDAERARATANRSTAHLCGHIDNFCQKFVRSQLYSDHQYMALQFSLCICTGRVQTETIFRCVLVFTASKAKPTISCARYTLFLIVPSR